jgi:calcium-dependent protein kinase
MITKDIFKKELTKHYGFNDAQYLTDKLFGKLDLDGSGEISYNEFLTSLMDDMQVVTLDRLDKAFRLFDKDGNGKLSIEEIMHVFGGNGNAWKKVIQEIDINNDGEVDFEEFKTLMLGLNSQKLI